MSSPDKKIETRTPRDIMNEWYKSPLGSRDQVSDEVVLDIIAATLRSNVEGEYTNCNHIFKLVQDKFVCAKCDIVMSDFLETDMSIEQIEKAVGINQASFKLPLPTKIDIIMQLLKLK